MEILQRINSVLNYKLEIDFNKRVNRNKSLVIVGLIFVFMNLAGYYIGTRWFWVDEKSYYDNQLSNLNQILKLNPESKDVQAQIAMTNYLNGDNEKAVKELKDILKKDGGNSTAIFDLGVILSEQKQYDEAIQLLSSYVAKRQGLETRIAYLYLGRNYLAEGNYTMALKNLKSAADRDQGNPVVFYYLGQTYEKLNNRKSAIQSYEKALEINSGYVEADRALVSMLKQAQEEKHGN